LVASASIWQAQVVELLNGLRVILGKPRQNYQPRSPYLLAELKVLAVRCRAWTGVVETLFEFPTQISGKTSIARTT